ncbi:hypothetical protein ACRRTK_012024 [Alexandromys fortis]
MEKKQNKYTCKTGPLHIYQSLQSTQSPRFTLVSYGKEHICSRLSENVLEDGGQTGDGKERCTCYLLDLKASVHMNPRGMHRIKPVNIPTQMGRIHEVPRLAEELLAGIGCWMRTFFGVANFVGFPSSGGTNHTHMYAGSTNKTQ